MKIVMMAAGAALLATPVLAQTPPAALQVEIPDLPTAAGDPTCGGRIGLAQQATCVLTTQGAIGGLVDTYSEAFSRQGWLAAGGDDNLVVYVKRRPGGGCDDDVGRQQRCNQPGDGCSSGGGGRGGGAVRALCAAAELI